MNKLYYIEKENGKIVRHGETVIDPTCECEIYAGYQEAILANPEFLLMESNKANLLVIDQNESPAVESVYIEKAMEAKSIINGDTITGEDHPYIMEQCNLTGEDPQTVASEVMIKANEAKLTAARIDAKRINNKRIAREIILNNEVQQ